MLEKNNMLKRLVYLFQQLMKKNSLFCIAALTVVIAALVISCSKNNEPVIEYDVDLTDGKWIVESTTGTIHIWFEDVFELNDTVRFIRYNSFGEIYISRAGRNTHYDEICDLHYFVKLGFIPSDDKKTFEVVMEKVHLLDIIESRKDRLVIQHRDTGTKVRMNRIE